MTSPAALTFAAGLLGAAVFAFGAAAQEASTGCMAPPGLTALGPAALRSADRIERGEKLTIVAVGSSSTQGAGASIPALNYPSRLEAELRALYPALTINVINRGKGGEDVAEELARFDRDVLAEHPDLVIWQVGTNAVLRRDDLAADRELIERGVAQLKASGSDVVLMDLQYAPRVIARPGHAEMEQMIAQVGKTDRVGLFRRFAIMRHWQTDTGSADAPMIGPDGLHMTDRSYGCLAARLAEALAANWGTQLYTVQGSRAPRIAGLPGLGDAARR